jgi:uroporphyrinogen-III synthase
MVNSKELVDLKIKNISNIKSILITQPKPESPKSPWYDLERKYGVKIDFCPFIKLVSLLPKEFRMQKVDINIYTAVIFTSKNAIEHFFKLTGEMKFTVNPNLKYFCISESVALFLQKFILYRKRKVNFGADGTNKGLFDSIQKHKNNESFFYPTSENQQDNEIISWLKENECEYASPYMYRSVSADVKDVINKNYDIICFFTPSGVRSLLENMPGFEQKKLQIGAFGNNTCKAVTDAGLTLHIQAPQPKAPGMLAALDKYIQENLIK